jgi:rhamnose transport system substrate-binding protein
MRSIYRSLTLAASAAIIAVALGACGSSGSNGSTSSGSGASGTNVAAISSSSHCSKGSVTVGYVPKLGTDPYMVTVRNAAQAAAKRIGGSVVYTSPNDATGPAQIPFVDQLIAQHVGVIAISGSDLNSAAAALKKATAQGIKVISFDSDVEPDARTLFIDQAQTPALGRMQLDSMYSMLHGHGDFAILSSTPTAVNQNAWIADMKQRLATDPKFAKMHLVTVAYGQEKADVNAQQAVALAQTYPNLKGIIVPAGIGLPAAAEALSRIGALGRIKLTGLAPASLIKKYILTGNVQDVWWNVTDLGTLSYYAAQALAQCKVNGKPGQTFKAGSLGTFTVGQNGLVILGQPKLVTPANVNAFAF